MNLAANIVDQSHTQFRLFIRWLNTRGIKFRILNESKKVFEIYTGTKTVRILLHLKKELNVFNDFTFNDSIEWMKKSKREYWHVFSFSSTYHKTWYFCNNSGIKSEPIMKSSGKKFFKMDMKDSISIGWEEDLSKIDKLYQNLNSMDIYVACSSEDEKKYQVEEIVCQLQEKALIRRVFFWKKDAVDLVDFMNEKIKESHSFVIFCSKNATESHGVQLEWKAAVCAKKHNVPVFENIDDVPLLIQSPYGVKINMDKFDPVNICNEIYSRIVRKINQS